MSGGKPTITSNDVADKFEKRHADVLKAIRNLITDDESDGDDRNFAEISYQDSMNRGSRTQFCVGVQA